MKVLRFFFKLLLVIVILAIAAAGILYHLSTRPPEGYQPNDMTPEQRAAAANRMEVEKWPSLTNYAAAAQSQAAKARTANPTTRPATATALQPFTITFTQDEINAALWKWTDPYKARFQQYVSSPYIRLDTGKIILMGTVPDFDKVLSLHFLPRVDEQGMLRCDLTSVRVGKVPLPEKLFNKQRAKLEASLRARLPQWQQSARIDTTGKSNSEAASAAMSKLLLQMLAHEPAPAIIFLPTASIEYKRPVPVRLTDIQVTPGALTITVRPLTPEETQSLLTNIRQAATNTPTPQNPG